MSPDLIMWTEKFYNTLWNSAEVGKTSKIPEKILSLVMSVAKNFDAINI